MKLAEYMDIAGRLSPRYLVAVLVILGLVQVSVEVAFGGFDSFPDTEEYLDTVAWFKDGTGEENLLRIQRPLQIIVVLAFEPALGAEGAFALTNAVFYILSIPFFWLLSRELLRDERLATLSTLLFMTSFCVLYWGLALATDMLVWLSLSVGVYMLLRLRDHWKEREVYALALVAGVAMLNKESLAILGLLLVAVYVQKHIHARPGLARRLADIIPPLTVMAIPFVAVQLWMLAQFGPGSTFFDFHVMHKTDDFRGNLLYIPITFLIAFNILWFGYVLGMRNYLSDRLSLSGREYIVWMAVTLLPVLAFEQYSPRLSFLPFFLVIPIAAIGIHRTARRISARRATLLIVAFLISYALASNIAALFGDELRELLGIWSK